MARCWTKVDTSYYAMLMLEHSDGQSCYRQGWECIGGLRDDTTQLFLWYPYKCGNYLVGDYQRAPV